MLFLLAVAARGACPSTSADVSAALAGAEAGFGDLELDAFRSAAELAMTELACLQEPLPRPVIANVHRVEGLRAFVDEDPAAATAAFASARAIEPTYLFPERVVPAEHPVRDQYTEQDPASGGRSSFPRRRRA